MNVYNFIFRAIDQFLRFESEQKSTHNQEYYSKYSRNLSQIWISSFLCFNSRGRTMSGEK